jgi:type I restriction enzyme S subunit
VSFPAYPEYKDSGVPWLGAVPRRWEVGQFKRLVEIQNGADYKHVEADAGYPVIGSGGVFTFASDYLYDGEAVLLGRKGTIDKPLHVTGCFWTVDTMYWAKIRPEVSGRFAFYAALTIPFTYYSTSTALPSMTQSALNAHMVALPNKEEQQAIAAFLDRETAKIDALVAEQERLIALLKEKRQAVISHAVSKGLNPDAPMKDSGIEWLGEIPAHWEVVRLGNLYREAVRTGSDDLPILSVSIHRGVSDYEIPDEDMERNVARSEDRSKYKRVQPNDLVYNMMRAWQGGFGAVQTHGQVSPAYVVAEPTRPLRSEFIEAVLRTPCAVEEMRRHSRGVTDFRLRLYWDEFKDIKIALPPPDEIDAILASGARIVTQFSALGDASRSGITLLQERRAALISAAVTGKIDVRGLVAPDNIAQADRCVQPFDYGSCSDKLERSLL